MIGKIANKNRNFEVFDEVDLFFISDGELLDDFSNSKLINN